MRPTSEPGAALGARLVPFVSREAERVASWVLSPIETYWLAPRTAPPIRAQTVRDWRGPGRTQWLLEDQRGCAVGYGEVNVLHGARREFWLGHLIVNPARRGLGFGAELTRRLLQYARDSLLACRVVLVVFPENQAAIRCYESAGLTADGYETQHFAGYGRRGKLLRMAYQTLRPATPSGRQGYTNANDGADVGLSA